MRIVQKPWGHEEIWAETSRYLGKILSIRGGHRLSRQYHEIKEETIRVLSGTVTIEVGEGPDWISKYCEGSVFHVEPRTIHRFCAYDGDVQLLEVSTPEIDDVVRIEDDYSR